MMGTQVSSHLGLGSRSLPSSDDSRAPVGWGCTPGPLSLWGTSSPPARRWPHFSCGWLALLASAGCAELLSLAPRCPQSGAYHQVVRAQMGKATR